MSGPAKLSRSGCWARFETMTWPTPDEDLEWRLTWQDQPSRIDLLRAAAIIGAYRELVRCPRAKRDLVVRKLRELTHPTRQGAGAGR